MHGMNVPPPQIPGVIKAPALLIPITLFMAAVVIGLAVYFQFVETQYAKYVPILLGSLVAAGFMFYKNLQNIGDVTLSQSGFEAAYKTGKIKKGAYADYEIHILSSNGGEKSKDSYYKILLKPRAPDKAESVILYHQVIKPANVQEIVENIQSSINSPMPVTFESEKVKQQYDLARSA